MTDRDRYVDETLKKQIQESYGASDEQLKARMDRIERTLTDDEFAGAEDRIMAKLMARIGVPEPKEEKVEAVTEVAAEAAVEIIEEVAEETLEVQEIVAEVETETEILETEETVLEHVEVDSEVEEEISATAVAGEEKVVRFGRKKVILVAALAAAFIGTLAVTTIGENSYFFREREKEIGVVFNSGKNISDVSSLEESYDKLKELTGESVFALGYLPSAVLFKSLSYENGRSIIELENNGNYLYFMQWKGGVEASVNVNSDRIKSGKITNKWLGCSIDYMENKLIDGTIEFEARIETEGKVCWFFGKINRKDFEEILKNIYLFD